MHHSPVPSPCTAAVYRTCTPQPCTAAVYHIWAPQPCTAAVYHTWALQLCTTPVHWSHAPQPCAIAMHRSRYRTWAPQPCTAPVHRSHVPHLGTAAMYHTWAPQPCTTPGHHSRAPQPCMVATHHSHAPQPPRTAAVFCSRAPQRVPQPRAADVLHARVPQPRHGWPCTTGAARGCQGRDVPGAQRWVLQSPVAAGTPHPAPRPGGFCPLRTATVPCQAGSRDGLPAEESPRGAGGPSGTAQGAAGSCLPPGDVPAATLPQLESVDARSRRRRVSLYY